MFMIESVKSDWFHNHSLTVLFMELKYSLITGVLIDIPPGNLMIWFSWSWNFSTKFVGFINKCGPDETLSTIDHGSSLSRVKPKTNFRTCCFSAMSMYASLRSMSKD